MHAVSTIGQGYIGSRVDQQPGSMTRSFAGLCRTYNLDRFSCELLQFARVQVLLTKLDEIDATLGRFGNLIQKPRPL